MEEGGGEDALEFGDDGEEVLEPAQVHPQLAPDPLDSRTNQNPR
jgi:hypothetical protein